MPPALESTTTEVSTETTTVVTKPEATTLEPTTSETTTQSEVHSNHTSAPCPTTSSGQNLYVCPTGFRRHPKHCGMFYQCTEKADSYDQSIIVFKCPNNTVYHEDSNRCDEAKPSDDCSTKRRTQTGLFEEEYKQSHTVRLINRLQTITYIHHTLTTIPLQIQIRSTASLCPSEGHFALNSDECAQLFVKCEYDAQTFRLEGHIFRCPKGFTYWSISRRCERTQKLQNCATTKYAVSTSIPVEWSNIGNRRRNLKL